MQRYFVDLMCKAGREAELSDALRLRVNTWMLANPWFSEDGSCSFSQNVWGCNNPDLRFGSE